MDSKSEMPRLVSDRYMSGLFPRHQVQRILAPAFDCAHPTMADGLREIDIHNQVMSGVEQELNFSCLKTIVTNFPSQQLRDKSREMKRALELFNDEGKNKALVFSRTQRELTTTSAVLEWCRCEERRIPDGSSLAHCSAALKRIRSLQAIVLFCASDNTLEFPPRKIDGFEGGFVPWLIAYDNWLDRERAWRQNPYPPISGDKRGPPLVSTFQTYRSLCVAHWLITRKHGRSNSNEAGSSTSVLDQMVIRMHEVAATEGERLFAASPILAEKFQKQWCVPGPDTLRQRVRKASEDVRNRFIKIPFGSASEDALSNQGRPDIEPPGVSIDPIRLFCLVYLRDRAQELELPI